ncbi:hypothetical protein CCR94_14435 [Rhodoblastus sphagnicola]|uniref:Uncharacterized protein n=1 Tax=Rhodoblastus sphagnicola TaxID=333368 RepID=A0A2S6N5G6_9HYPH|nr:hypothetical protein [Rhodoblastus sphagnicola]MBB4197225.1 hypothetical protein [Rhodoblastus sphagnicola]PPQ29837.1 hypothetical protein CCR94_14435 [Rhodoblastus sphagnicola]
MPHRLKHALLTVAAVVFLIEAWLWDLTIALGHWVVGLLPWREFKATVVRIVQRLPPYGALPLFLIPFVVIEPLKIIAIEQIAHGHFFRGVLAFIVLKFVGVGLIAFIFDLTREKLLAIGWFASFYRWVVKWRDKAHAFIEPYKVAVRARIADLKFRISEIRRRLNLSAGKGGVMELLVRLRARARKPQG